MSVVRPRISIDENLWNAVEAASKALGIHPSTYIERAVKTMLDPSEVISNAARVSRESIMNMVETQDQIRVISNFVVDRYRSVNEE